MKVSELKKDTITSVRVNSEVKQILIGLGFKSVQQFLDEMIDKTIEINTKTKKTRKK